MDIQILNMRRPKVLKAEHHLMTVKLKKTENKVSVLDQEFD